MTRNQIAYHVLQEDRRKNLVQEAETHRSHIADETERNRHNLKTESQTDIDVQTRRRAQESKSFNDYVSPFTNLAGKALSFAK